MQYGEANKCSTVPHGELKRSTQRQPTFFFCVVGFCGRCVK